MTATPGTPSPDSPNVEIIDEARLAARNLPAVIETGALAVSRPPDLVVEEARKAAVVLKGVIDSKAKPVIFNGEQYLEFEDWQTVAKFYGCTARTVPGSTRYVQYGDACGFEATAEVVHVQSGLLVSSAEAMCLNDEEKWRARPKYEYHYVRKSDGGTQFEDPGRNELIWEEGSDGKKRPKKLRVCVGEEAVPLFQLKSMAQTRACAKALSNAFRWVVVLAGYKTTPAEEMDHRRDDTGPEREIPNSPQSSGYVSGGASPQAERGTPPVPEPQRAPVSPPPQKEQYGFEEPKPTGLTEAQQRRFFGVAMGAGWTRDEIVARWGKDAVKVKPEEYNGLLNAFKDGSLKPSAKR